MARKKKDIEETTEEETTEETTEEETEETEIVDDEVSTDTDDESETQEKPEGIKHDQHNDGITRHAGQNPRQAAELFPATQQFRDVWAGQKSGGAECGHEQQRRHGHHGQVLDEA